MLKQAAHNGLLLCFLTAPVIAQEQSLKDVKTEQQGSVQKINCEFEQGSQSSCTTKSKVDGEQADIEHITVQGRYIGLIVPEIEGRYTFDRNFIDALPISSGDISEMLVNLPGVQLGSEFYDADNQAEIGAARVSISGGDAWQTGFFLDGVNFNSRQDPSSYKRSFSDVNDVRGNAQNFNVNQQIVESIEVYTNNVPVQYGSFSGGVVEVETKDFNFDNPEFGFSYRTSKSDWNQYHIIEGTAREQDDFDFNPVTPSFEKEVINLNGSIPLDEHHGVFFALSRTTSDITELSLGDSVLTQRESSNWLLKLTQNNLWFDKAELTLNYSPYDTSDVLEDVRNSEFTVEGGGFSSSILVEQDLDAVELTSKLSFSHSDNSRRAPEHYFNWRKARGKDWGNGNPSVASLISREGGYGDLDKQQQTLSWKLDADWTAISTGLAEHNVSAGLHWQHENLHRERFSDTYIYNSPSIENRNLDCSGHRIDCLEVQYRQSIEEIEAQLGEPIDFLNLEHLALLENNVLVSPQAFRSRLVYQQENLDVDVQNLSMYLVDNLEWQNLSLNLGLRYDFDDFLKNHNVAPRLSGGYNLFGDKDYLFTFGASRYYDSNLLTYKVRESQLPFLKQSRAIVNSTAQNWRPTSDSAPFRYIFREVDTPYNDEFVLGWKHATDFGSYNIEYVKRKREQQISRSGSNRFYNPEDGIQYRFAENSGSGHNERISLSWSWQYLNNSFWANTTYQLSESYRLSNEVTVEAADIESLIFLRTGNATNGFSYNEIHESELEVAEAEFSQPLTFNLGWTNTYFEQLTTTLIVNVQQSYSDFVYAGETRRSERAEELCSNCEEQEFFIDVLEQVRLPSRALVNASVKWTPKVAGLEGMTIRFDIQNLLDERTYSVSPNDYGIETGRSLWLEIGYNW